MGLKSQSRTLLLINHSIRLVLGGGAVFQVSTKRTTIYTGIIVGLQAQDLYFRKNWSLLLVNAVHRENSKE